MVYSKAEVDAIFERIVANHEKKIASRARIRQAQAELGSRVSKRTRARRKAAKKEYLNASSAD